MAEQGATNPVAARAVALRDWFRRDVEDKLAEAVGGPARLSVVALLAAVLALQSADTATVGAVAAPLESALHITNTDIGLLVTVSTAIGAVATLPVGKLVDRAHRTRLLAISIRLACSPAVQLSARNARPAGTPDEQSGDERAKWGWLSS